MKKCLFLLVLMMAFLNAQELKLVKGQALILSFEKKNLLKISLSGKDMKFFTHPKDAQKVVFILASPYKKPLENANLKVIYKDKELSYKISSTEGTYKKETLQVAKNKVSPPKNVLERIKKELKEANAVYATYTDKALFEGEFIQPLNSAITSEYGTARVYNNGVLSSFHGGTDFRAAVGVKVYATNDGVVRIAKDRYYAGNSVVIDHGYGIFTQYYHLSKLEVKAGQRVKKGELIGLSGASGRVTGAHLHFGVFVARTQVDPLDFIKKFNALLK